MMNMLQQWIGKMAREAVKREQPLVIAITGAVGKSTTKQMIGALFEASGTKKSVRVSPKNYNNELGVPLTIFNANAPGRSISGWLWLLQKAWLSSMGVLQTCPDILVLEMGADKPGDIKYLTSIAPPDIAIITAVTPEGEQLAPVHRANYSSTKAVVREKAELIRALKAGGTAILNADDPSVFSMRHETNSHVLTFGETETADIRILSSEIMLEEDPHGNVPTGLSVSLQHWGHTYQLTFKGVFGRPIALAAAVAIGVAEATDTSFEAVRNLSRTFKPMPGRTRIIPGIKHTTLFDDSYNASPAAVISAMRDVTNLKLASHQRKIVCLGEMRELGDEAENLHRKVAAEAAHMGVDFLVCCGIFADAMKVAAQEAGLSSERVKAFADTPEAGLFLQDEIRPGDVVLAKASEGTNKTKGVRMERVIKELMAEPLRASELLVRQEAVWQRK